MFVMSTCECLCLQGVTSSCLTSSVSINNSYTNFRANIFLSSTLGATPFTGIDVYHFCSWYHMVLGKYIYCQLLTIILI